MKLQIVRRPAVLVSLSVFALLPCLPEVFAEAVLPPTPERRKELVHLVRQDCGSCHGMTLQGGLGPPLTPAVLRGKAFDSLVATVHGGRPGTPMPPWHRFLSEAEARWIVEQLQAGFPEER